MKLDPTVERLNFNQISDTTAEHLHRYAITQNFITSKKVLDIASGEGYGSFLMSKFAESVCGVDINQNSVVEANSKYQRNNLKFVTGRADAIPFKDDSFDVVVSYETIEHHDQHTKMFEEIKRVLKSDGILIMSSPDKKYYSDLTGYKNKFHVRELYFNEFQLLSQTYFEYTDFYFQKSYNLSSYIFDHQFYKSVCVYSGDQNELYVEEMEPLYNIVIASNHKLYKIKPSIYDGRSLAKRSINKLIKQNTTFLKKSISYRIGHFIVYPFSFLKRTILNGKI